MVTICLNGRLGNQLFQYAFAVALSRRYRTFYVIDDSIYADSVKKYFEPISLTDNKYMRRILRKYYSSKRLDVVVQTGFEEMSGVHPLITDKKYYNGYFQSVQYIENILLIVKDVFRIKPVYKQVFNAKYAHLFEQHKVLAIHCRVGDYVTWGGDILGGTNLVLPSSYYKNALALLPDAHTYKIVVVTDDMAGAQEMFSFIPEKTIISDQEIIDFQMLMHANKLIISNSTFAWWAAFLNTKHAQVFAPEYWLGFKVKKEYPSGILPPQFTAVPFG